MPSRVAMKGRHLLQWIQPTDELRSRIMRSNKGWGNFSTELTLLRLMRSAGICGWRRSIPLIGRPDFVFRRERVVVFVDGCFWHGCKCKRLPKANRAFWRAKIYTNQARDRRRTRQLRAEGWNVIRVWEHQLRKRPAFVVGRITRALERILDRRASNKNPRRR